MIIEEHRGFRVVVVATELPGGTPRIETRIEELMGCAGHEDVREAALPGEDIAGAERLGLEAAKFQIAWQLAHLAAHP